ncbi:MAG: hypothetical protein WAS73_18540 [Defluviicoccus sp.]
MFRAPLNRRFARRRTQWLASAAVAAGQGLPMIGKLLGHTQVQTAARYAHLAADPVKAAAEQVSAAIAGAVSGGEERSKAAAGR